MCGLLYGTKMKKQTEEEKFRKKIERILLRGILSENPYLTEDLIVDLLHRQKEELLEEVTKKVGEEFGIDIKEIFNQLKDEETN